MPLIYRSMTRDGDHPKVGATAKTLGVRVPGDLPSDDGQVSPGTGGMSVAPSWRDLPPHRIPRRLLHLAPDAAGSDADACWRMGVGPFEAGAVAEGLSLRPDRPDHGLVEPSERMTLERYQAALAATRDLWQIDED
jgi:hypothetical protein